MAKIPKGLSDKDMLQGYVEQVTLESQFLAAEEAEDKRRRARAGLSKPEKNIALTGFTDELTEELGRKLLELKMELFRGMNRDMDTDNMNFLSALVFGVVFSVGWTPCVGVFLGSALMLASQQGSAMTGILMLLCYSLGLGVPFLISAVLIDQLKNAFNFIKRNYTVINRICGVLLIIVGILMATGLMNRFVALIQ